MIQSGDHPFLGGAHSGFIMLLASNRTYRFYKIEKARMTDSGPGQVMTAVGEIVVNQR